MALSKFTEANRAILLDRFAAGVTVEEAARGLDLYPKTVKGWLTRGRRETEGPYAEFAEAVAAAREEAKAAAANVMTRDEFDEHLAKAVRAGSVQAMKLYWEIDRERRKDDGGPDPFAEFDAAIGGTHA
jgi:transposase-like protein